MEEVKPQHRSMGLGKLGNPGLLFVRQFRFTIAGDHLDESFNQRVHVNWSGKSIYLSAYEVYEDGKIAIHEWIKKMQAGEYPDETLTLITYDACGHELYKRRFTGLHDVSQINSFYDYSKNDVVSCSVLVHYTTCEELEPTKTAEPYRNSPKDLDKICEVDHLNGKMFLKD